MANFMWENETKNVIFSQGVEYAITGLRIKFNSGRWKTTKNIKYKRTIKN